MEDGQHPNLKMDMMLMTHIWHEFSCSIFFSQGLADNTVVAKVNDVLWDLDRPFEGDANLKLIKFEDKDGK